MSKDLRSTVMALQLRMDTHIKGTKNIDIVQSDDGDQDLRNLSSEQILSDFMRLAGEPITWVEARELWNDIRSTNNGALPKFSDALSKHFHSSAT